MLNNALLIHSVMANRHGAELGKEGHGMSSRPLASATAPRVLAMPSTSSVAWAIAAVILMLGVHLAVVFMRWINWDEFIVYSQIHQLARGELTAPLQTFQTRLFQWVLTLEMGNVDQIIATRWVMFGCMLVTAASIVALAEGFTTRKVALICALGFLSMGFVIQHGTALRTDGMAAALLMASLAVMLRSRLGIGSSLLVALLVSVAALVTLKSVLYAPAFAGIAWLRWQEAGRTREATLRLIALAAMVPALFAALYVAHSSQLPLGTDAGAVATQSAALMIRPFVMEEWGHLVKGTFIAPFLSAMLVAAIYFLFKRGERSAAERLALAGMMLPLTSFMFYTNAYAYFYVFILPPACVACLLSVEPAIRRYSVALISICLAINGVAVFSLEDLNLQANQRRMVDGADQIFPEPINYFDGSAQLGQFRKVNVLLDAWNLQRYKFGGYETSMEAATDREVIPLVLANTGELMDTLEKNKRNWRLQPRDVTMMRDTYIRFWGPYFIAGEDMRAGETRAAKIRVPGPYTVREGPLAINGMMYLPGEVVELDRGIHRLTASAQSARLIWGERLEAPALPGPREPYWAEF